MLTYGSSGIGGAGHLAGALLDREAGIRTIHVPYRGGGPMMTDLISGKVDFAFSTAPTALPQIEGGRLRALAVPTARRSPITGALPAISETLPGFEVANWYALLGPKNLPAAIVTRMGAALQATLRDPEIVAQMARQGTEPRPGAPEELARFIREETEKWAPIVRATGATPN
jgi:tripartite-type tricarboxylate transporter receptor subunit TctC